MLLSYNKKYIFGLILWFLAQSPTPLELPKWEGWEEYLLLLTVSPFHPHPRLCSWPDFWGVLKDGGGPGCQRDQPWDWRVGTLSPAPRPPVRREAGDWVQAPRASGVVTVMEPPQNPKQQELKNFYFGEHMKGSKALCPSLYLVLQISCMWLFLSFILHNKPVGKPFSWVLGAILANYWSQGGDMQTSWWRAGQWEIQRALGIAMDVSVMGLSPSPVGPTLNPGSVWIEL